MKIRCAAHVFLSLFVAGSVSGQDKYSQIGNDLGYPSMISLTKALSLLEEAYDVSIFYNDALVEGKNASYPNSNKQDIYVALGEVLGEHEIAYAKTGARTITLSSKKFSKQKGHIQGHIVDERTKQPMIGANVTVMGTNFGAATNTEGIYRIENLQEEVYKLKVSYIGYVDFVETDVLVIRGKTT